MDLKFWITKKKKIRDVHDTILDYELDGNITEEEKRGIKHWAKILYGLIHARYIMTSRGMAAMLQK
jgi:hypothetical protein